MIKNNRTFPRFGVTKFKNGQCLVQSIYPVGNRNSDSSSEIIGIANSVEEANAMYLNSYDNSEWTGQRR